MPNWCATTITICNENKEENNVFYHLMKEWTSRNYMSNGFGHKWLGNIVLGSKIGTVDTNPETDLSCRGSVCHWEYDGNNTFVFETDTAWTPMLKMWSKLIDKYMPDAEMIFAAEECGMCIYDTNDPTLAGMYIVEVWDEIPIETDDRFEVTKSELKEFLMELFDDKESSFKELMKKFDDSDFRDAMSINKWEYVDIEVYC
jgi:hypothetical protein